MRVQHMKLFNIGGQSGTFVHEKVAATFSGEEAWGAGGAIAPPASLKKGAPK